MAFDLVSLNLDAKSVEPIAIIAAAAVGGFFLWKYLQNQQAQSQAAQSQAQEADVLEGSAGYTTADLEDLALMQQLGLTGSDGGGATSEQPTYSAPGGPSTSTGTTNTTGGSGTTGASGTGTSGAAAGTTGGNWTSYLPLTGTGNGVG